MNTDPVVGTQTQTQKTSVGARQCLITQSHPHHCSKLQISASGITYSFAPFAGECCSHPSPATEHLESTRELFPAVMSLHYANHLVLGTHFTGVTAAKLSGSAMIMDTQGSNTLFSQQKWGNFLFRELFSELCHMLVFYLERDSGPWKR